MSKNSKKSRSSESEINLVFGKCRCCLEYGYMMNLWGEHFTSGEREVYGEMLVETFSIAWESNGKDYICEPCVARLRDANNFKKDLLTSAQYGGNGEESDEYETEEDSQIWYQDEDKKSVGAEDERGGERVKEELQEEDYEEVEYLDEYLESLPEAGKKVKAKVKKGRKRRRKEEMTRPYYKRYSSMAMIKAIACVQENNYTIGDAAKKFNVPRKTLTAKVHAIKTGKAGDSHKEESDGSIDTDREIERRAREELNRKNYKYLGGDEVHKHKDNVQSIVKWSNATSIKGHGSDGFACNFCNETFKYAKELKTHTLTDHKQSLEQLHTKHTLQLTIRFDITDLKCKICNESLTTIEDLLHHLKTHDKVVHTDIKNQIIPYAFPKNKFSCFKCRKLFKFFKPLTDHMIEHYKVVDCSTCGRGFISKKYLTKHEARHKSGEVKCSYCGKEFANRDFALTHERLVHQRSDLRVKYPSKNFECEPCNKKFPSGMSLKEHNHKIHLKEERFFCDRCGKGFYLKSDLLDHLVLHSEVKEYKCSLCPKAYARRRGLVEHLRVHANDRRFRCEICGERFIKNTLLKNHKAAKHGE